MSLLHCIRQGRYRIVTVLERFKILFDGPIYELAIAGWLDLRRLRRPWIMSALHQKLMNHFATEQPLQILSLGLGAGMSAHLEPHWHVNFVEGDAEVARIAASHFRLPRTSKIFLENAQSHIENAQQDLYDVLLYDLFMGRSCILEPLTPTFIRRMLERLRPGGLLCLDIAGRPSSLDWLANILDEPYEITARGNYFPANRLWQNILVTKAA